MYIHSGNFFFINGKVVELITTTRKGREKDIELENQETFIIPELVKLMKKNAFYKQNNKKFSFDAPIKTDDNGRVLKSKLVTAHTVFLVFFEDVNWLVGEKSFSISDEENNTKKKNAKKFELRATLSPYNSWEFTNFDKVRAVGEKLKSKDKDQKHWKLYK